MADTMVFLAYTPRSDSVARGYEHFLREVDNPFFNAQPGVAHYSNWKFLKGTGVDPGFSHFDFMVLEKGVLPLTVFGSQVLQAFVGEWTAAWGRAPDGPQSDNCHCYLASLVAKPEPEWTRYLTLALDDEAAPGETWQVTGQLIGQAPFKTFTRQFLTRDNRPGPVLCAELIAAP